MFVVALAELGSSEESELSAIAHDVGLGVYDLRMRIAAGLPAVVLTTADRAEASAAVESMRSRGHGVLLCDLGQVVAGTAMVPVRRFAFEEDGLRADRASPEVLAYRQMRALVHVAHIEQHRMIGHEMVFVSPRQGVQRRETITHENDSTQSLYIFRDDGECPWILRERDAQYAALGAAAGPVQHLNFLATIAALRARAPMAHFDDRLAAHPRSPTHFTRSYGRPEGGSSPWADHGADLAAHLLAEWVAQRHADPYRSPAG